MCGVSPYERRTPPPILGEELEGKSAGVRMGGRFRPKFLAPFTHEHTDQCHSAPAAICEAAKESANVGSSAWVRVMWSWTHRLICTSPREHPLSPLALGSKLLSQRTKFHSVVLETPCSAEISDMRLSTLLGASGASGRGSTTATYASAWWTGAYTTFEDMKGRADAPTTIAKLRSFMCLVLEECHPFLTPSRSDQRRAGTAISDFRAR